MRTTLKKYAVGSPAQAAVETAVLLMREAGGRAGDIDAIESSLPSDNWAVVNNREMPDINVQYLATGPFFDGGFSFEMAHASDLMQVAGRGARGRHLRLPARRRAAHRRPRPEGSSAVRPAGVSRPSS
jgi:hypothetical protein